MVAKHLQKPDVNFANPEAKGTPNHQVNPATRAGPSSNASGSTFSLKRKLTPVEAARRAANMFGSAR